MKCDTREILRALRLILAPGQVTELRALEATTTSYAKFRTIFGYFDDPAKLAAAVGQIATAKGIYFTPNPVDPSLLARAQNRLKDAGKNETTSDKDITGRRWLLIDCDAIRKAGISASDAEHKAALDRALNIRADLAERGWPEPIYADSGNGAHLLYRVDLPTDDDGLIERCLDALADQHGDDVVAVDRSVHNPARIWKLYGTVACKGDSTAERPHRMARIIEAPAVLGVVTLEQLQELAAQAPVKAAPAAPIRRVNGYGRFDLDAFLSRNASKLPAMQGPEPYQGGRRWIFGVCPWNPDHNRGEAWLIQRADGVLQAGCRHDSCKKNNWHTLRAMIEPKAPPTSPAEPSSNEPARGADLPAYAPFPVEALPAVLEKFARGMAGAMGVPVEMIAVPALVVCAAAVGNACRVWINPSWQESCILWAVPLLDSGDLKTPPFKEAARPLHQLQAKAEAEYRQRLERYEQDLNRYEADFAAWKKHKGIGDAPVKPEPPTPVDYFTSDCTIEGMALMQQANPRGVPLLRDELSGFLSRFGQYKGGRGGDEASWEEMYTCGTFKVNRAGKRVFVRNASASICGTCQPAVFERAIRGEKNGEGNLIECGIAARFLVFQPPIGPKTWHSGNLPPGIAKGYADLITKLLDIPLAVDDAGDVRPRDIPLNLEAQQRFARFVNDHGAEKARIDDSALRYHYAKLEGAAGRLALLVHLVRWAGGESVPADHVDLASVEVGIALVEWFKVQAQQVYGRFSENPAQRLRRELVERIRRAGGSMTARELAHSSRRYRESGAAEDALQELVGAGLGSWDSSSADGPGRPANRFVLGTHMGGDGDTNAVNLENVDISSPSPGVGEGIITGRVDDRDHESGDPDAGVVTP